MPANMSAEWCESEASYYDHPGYNGRGIYNQEHIVAALKVAAAALRWYWADKAFAETPATSEAWIENLSALRSADAALRAACEEATHG